MKMIHGMLCAATILSLCSMSMDGGDDLAGAGDAATQDDPPVGNQALAESEGAQQNETDGAAENQDSDEDAGDESEVATEADEEGDTSSDSVE